MTNGNNEVNTGRVHRKKTSKMSRRTLTKTLLGLGFSTSSAMGVSADDIDDAHSSQVPIDERIGPDSVIRHVPKDWYDRYRHTQRVLDKSSFIKNKGVIAQLNSPGKIGGDNPHIVVRINNENARGKIPERKDGVRVEVETAEIPKKNACEDGDHCGDVVNDWNYSPIDKIRGGTVWETGIGGYCTTLAGRMIHKSDHGLNNDWFLACRHAFNGCNWSDVEGQDGYTPDREGYLLGWVVDGEYENDWVLLSPGDVGQFEPTHKVRGRDSSGNSAGKSYDVISSFTKDALAAMSVNGEYLYRSGVGTCEVRGQLGEVGGTQYWHEGSCDSIRTSQSEGVVDYYPPDNAGGDSGAITWGIASNGDLQAACIHLGYIYSVQGVRNMGTGIFKMYENKGYYYSGKNE